MSLVLVQSLELVREREKRALPRLPELPGFQGLLCCSCRLSWGMSPQELRGQSPSWLSTPVCSYQPSGAKTTGVPGEQVGGQECPPSADWGTSRSLPRRRPGTQMWVGTGAVVGVQAMGTGGPAGADSSTGLWGLQHCPMAMLTAAPGPKVPFLSLLCCHRHHVAVCSAALKMALPPPSP